MPYETLAGRACNLWGDGNGPDVGAVNVPVSDDNVTSGTTTEACQASCDESATCHFVVNQIEGVTLEEYNALKEEGGDDFGCTLYTLCLDEVGEGETGFASEGSSVQKNRRAHFAGAGVLDRTLHEFES